ncbi:MAG: serine hydrolase [Vitreimonas sp.]
MRRSFTRRVVITSGLAAAAACAPTTAAVRDDRVAQFQAQVRQIEQRIGGRLGVVALNSANDAALGYRADERFAMCSMFKWMLAAQVLEMDMHIPGFLAQRVRFTEADLAHVGWAPVTRANLARGWMSVEELAEAAVEQSDNGAANLLLERAMGPAGLTRFLRANGDSVTRLDRNEPALNENAPGDERDTTTPNAMAHTMARFLAPNPARKADRLARRRDTRPSAPARRSAINLARWRQDRHLRRRSQRHHGCRHRLVRAGQRANHHCVLPE